MNEHVLIADADSERGKGIAEACATRGLSCTLTTHGAAALEAALANPPAVIICQLELPLIDGPRLSAILDANPRTRGTGLLFVADRAGESRDSQAPGRIFEPPLDADQVSSCVQALIAQGIARPEPVESIEPEEGGVEGELGRLPMTDLLELFHVSRKTGVVELSREAQGQRQEGHIALRGGDVFHAATGDAQGIKAFFRLLGWGSGRFSFRPGIHTMPVTIDTPTRALLREGQRQLEEWERAGVELPRMDAQVRLKVQRSALPNVIHPLTQEVLLVLELHSRVSDVVEHCSYPDYQVLRTLATLVERGIVELEHESEPLRPCESEGPYSPAQVTRLREWTGDPRSPGEIRDAVLLVVSSGLEATREFMRRLQELPDVEIDARTAAGAFDEDDLLVLGRVAVGEGLGIQLVQLPPAPGLAPFWATAANAALGSLLLISGPVGEAMARLGPVTEALRSQPRSRIFHLLLVGAGECVEPGAMRKKLSPIEDASLFLIPIEQPPKARALLREVLARALP